MPRLFIAARLPESLLDDLARARDALALHSASLRPVGRDSLHLTLRFIGQVEDSAAEAIKHWFSSLALPVGEDFCARWTGLGACPGREGDLVYAAFEAGPGLCDFQGQIERGLREMGLPPDTRPFFPHVTLARRVRLTEPLDSLRFDVPGVHQILPAATLFESVLKPGGAVYRPLADLPRQ